ncbi:hypothetical protein QFZ66_005962 [Streptomyces sp. B4I13]|uniref:hypothetical protein n=1 Tax=Streptomyces sp. B4I13 TaxID=3042271 RepID=UPI002781C5C0|nr:hypothetical protein [Streptomyces sp. B4I13]MDQ0962084.1 hypothetical protein [Streptomyces sp. B4I13]
MHLAQLRHHEIRPAYGPPVSAAPWWVSGYSMRWTWRVTRFLDDRVFEHVADTFHAWGVSSRQADLLGELAVDYAGDVRKVVVCRYVAVTATLEGFRATVSVIPAHAPAPVHGAPVPNRGRPFLETSWGRVDLEPGPCLYAGINLIGVKPI